MINKSKARRKEEYLGLLKEKLKELVEVIMIPTITIIFILIFLTFIVIIIILLTFIVVIIIFSLTLREGINKKKALFVVFYYKWGGGSAEMQKDYKAFL